MPKYMQDREVYNRRVMKRLENGKKTGKSIIAERGNTMKIDTAKITGYENMSAEEKLAALESYEYDDNAKELETLKNQLSKANSEAAKNKREKDSQKADDDRAMSELKERLAELEKRERLSTARARFLGLGIEEGDAASMAECLADAGLSDEAANTLFAGLKKHIASVEKKAKSNAMTGASKPQGSGAEAGAVDYSAKIQEAQNAGDFSAAAYYTRLQAQAVNDN